MILRVMPSRFRIKRETRSFSRMTGLSAAAVVASSSVTTLRTLILKILSLGFNTAIEWRTTLTTG